MAPTKSVQFVPPLQVLSQQVSDAAQVISHYCENAKVPHPSLDSLDFPADTPKFVLEAQAVIQSTAIKLQQIAVGPGDFIAGLAIPYQTLVSIQWLCRFKIMFHVPRDCSMPYTAVAQSAGVPIAQLKSISRMAMLTNFFAEPVPGELANSPLSLRFVDDPSLLEWLLYIAEIGSPTAGRMVEATERWGVTSHKAQTAANLFFKTEKPLFDYFATRPDLSQKFAGYMKNASRSPATSPDHVLRGFDWASLGKGTVVDIGGSKCHITLALAGAFPELRFVVQDLPAAIAAGRTLLKDRPSEMTSRITLQDYDFFRPQPVIGADVYLFRTIFHDWADHDAIRILNNQVSAMAENPQSRLLIVDIVLPEPGSVDLKEESLLRVQDLKMMQTFNSYERELSDWMRLLDEANDLNQLGGRFGLKGVSRPFGSLLSVLEIVLEI
ncbi:S-adenosyl-L-methionine-dependent methyltransferase [Myriangium duriaei CBS 260.36]|uniref:S-adenosyl-L-methionine-dependent methyltransferase n=1 Tax=Myriangium duriaei CBS 260.36 TaxID=1168546 RepID=A0A9P4MJD7_9PEZI|nr:S-adenosyl-L-methionine-dependent methyltransferase [Myriangium duriaei CBS 260.36]